VLAAVPIVLASPFCARFLPRVPGLAFYVFYPAHLLAIWLAFGSYR
jgi:hypothetical protein